MIVASISGTVDDGFAVFFAWLPHVLGFLAILLIGYIVAKLVAGIVRRATHRAGLDRAVHRQIGGSYIQRVIQSPSGLLGTLTFWALWLSAISLAVSVLGVDALKNFVASVWSYLPNVLAAVLIFLVAGAIAGAVVTLAKRVLGDTPLGKIVATAAPILIMSIATFMILDQLKIAHNIVVITYAALMGAIALGAALAFGLGGRDVAARMLESAYEKGQENKDQYRRDLDGGIARARQEAQAAQDNVRPQAAGATTRP
jgi:hypothetical protein